MDTTTKHSDTQIQQIATMLKLQAEMNSIINEDWMNADYPWYRAIWIECAELLDHTNWKWWNDKPGDLYQVKLELVDIWHFGLSDLFTREVGAEKIHAQFDPAYHASGSLKKLDNHVETFVLSVLRSRQFNVVQFGAMCGAVWLSFEELYKMYVGKNVLNRFRQKHGYKEGTYIKQWGAEEDNGFLQRLLEGCDSTVNHDMQKWIWDALMTRYVKVLAVGRSNETLTLDAINEELASARAKWSTNADMLHAVNEEAGELTRALMEQKYEPDKGVTSEDIRKEAIQVAATAIRIIEEGDSNFPDYKPD